VDSKTWLLGGGILALIVAVGFACYMWGAAEERAKIAASPRDTTIVTHPQYTLPYVAQGPVVSKPKLPKPLLKDTASNYNSDTTLSPCLRDILLDTIARQNAELAQYRDVDSFTEDSLRYSLAVTWDGSKQEGTRFWRWLELKPYPYSDTLATVTQTVVQPSTRDWIPWGITGVAIILLIINMLWG
jgi:hypothetical protein